MVRKNYINKKEGKSIWLLDKLFFFLYRINNNKIRYIIRWLILRLEKGMYYSLTIRKIFLEYHNIEVGMYSGCGNFSITIFKPGTKIGRYTTIDHCVRAFNANHPMNTKSSHALFFNHRLGIVKRDLIKRGNLTIGNDVFIGYNVLILPRVNSIGDGAYIGAGTVVTKNVPPYAIVVGDPSNILRFRYPKNKIKELLDSKWWEQSIEELQAEIETFQCPLDGSDHII